MAVIPALGNRIQWGYVVRDLDEALDHWTRTLRVGPFIRVADVGADCRFEFHGSPIAPRIDAAFSYLGDTQIELICPRDATPSPYTAFLAAGREGLQHLGFWVDDHAAACRQVEAGGMRAVFSVLLPGALRPTTYYETPASLGTMIEVAEHTARKGTLYAAMAQLARGWDGTRPVRPYASMAAFAADAGVLGWG